MSQPIYKKMLDYIETVNEVTKVASQIIEKQQEKVASETQIDTVVAELKSVGLLQPNQVKLAKEQLSSPSSAMQILLNVVQSYKSAAEKRASVKAEDIGKPEKSASAPVTKSARDEKLLALINK